MGTTRQITYVMGAGLTKSLEVANARIPLMYDFISVMANYLDSPIVVATLSKLEQGAVFEWSEDQWKVLARDLGLSEAHRTRKKLEAYRSILKKRPSENIETLLQRCLASENVFAQAALTGFGFAINAVFSRIGWDLNWCPLETFLQRQFSLPDTRHTFVSFNYDLVLDRCVQMQSKFRWSVQSGYGFDVSYYTDVESARTHMGQFNYPPGVTGGSFSVLPAKELCTSNGSDDSISLLKPHGSLNWLVHFEGNYQYLDETPVLCLDSDLQVGYYPPFDCRHLALPGQSPRPDNGLLIIPPTDSKVRNMSFLRSVRDREKEAFRTADEVYVIGWSMPETDSDQTCLIATCVADRDEPFERVTVINNGATPSYYNRITTVFGIERSSLIVHNDGFSTYLSR